MVQINKIPIFTDEVFYFKLPNFDIWKKQIEQIVLVEDNKKIHGVDTSPEESCNIHAKRTAWNSHVRYPILNDLCNEIKNYLIDWIKQEDFDIPSLDLEECWINWYKKNNYAQPHQHKQYLAVVLFVDVEASGGGLYFHSDKNYSLVKKSNSHTNFSNAKKINSENGTVIFFDGSLHHSVIPNEKEEKRITMAMNFRPSYFEGRGEY